MLERRWVGFHVLTVVMCCLFVAASMWQVDRRDQRGALNAVIEANAGAPPAAVEDLLPVLERGDRTGLPGARAAHWRTVTATGRYDSAAELLVRNRTLSGAGVGFEVLTPLVTEDGTALVVDRGWVAAAGSAQTLPEVPPAPAGEVTVTGRVRPGEATPARDEPPAGQLLAVDVGRVAAQVPYPVYDGFVQAVSEQPAAAGQVGLDAPVAPQRLPEPQTSSGPHLAYAVQWALFVVVALGGWVMIIRREAIDRRHAAGRTAPRHGPPSPRSPVASAGVPQPGAPTGRS